MQTACVHIDTCSVSSSPPISGNVHALRDMRSGALLLLPLLLLRGWVGPRRARAAGWPAATGTYVHRCA